MAAIPMCLVFVLNQQTDEILLGLKHTGIGATQVVGLGGHIDDGETSVQAAAREVMEESGLAIATDALRPAGSVKFRFPAKPQWDQDVDVYTATEYSGILTACDEITPRWFPLTDIPYAEMWDDAKLWLPAVLSGMPVATTITYGSDNRTVAGQVFADG